MYDVSKLTGKGVDKTAVKNMYFGAIGQVGVPASQLHDQFNETIPDYYSYVQGKQVPVFLNKGSNTKPVMITANEGDHLGQSELHTHDSTL